MHNIWFTSDTHFGHKNIIEYNKRPYASVDEMDAALIANWNARVKYDDTIYHLGDFAFTKAWRFVEILSALNGFKHWVCGNHDHEALRLQAGQFSAVYVDRYVEIKIGDAAIVLCHFPLLSWNQSHRGAWNLHGHLHGDSHNDPLILASKHPRRVDVGVDCWNYAPVSFGEIVASRAGANASV